MQNNPTGISVLWFSHSAWIPGMYTTEHSHPFFHFGCFISGRPYHEKSKTLMPEHHLYCVAPFQVHGGYASTEEDVIQYECKFTVSDSQLYKRLEAFPFDKITLDKGTETLLKTLANDIRTNHISNQCLNAAFYHIITRLMDINNAVLVQEKPTMADACQKVKDYIDQYYYTDINLNQLAEVAGMSRSYISRTFSQTQGMTIIDYLNQVRVRSACDLIAYTNKPINEIYKKCGFNDLHNFGRVFKQVVGIPPSKYRQPQDTDVFNYSGDINSIRQDISKKGYFTYAASPQKYVSWPTHLASINQAGVVK